MKNMLILYICLLTITIGWAQERRIIPYAEQGRQWYEVQFANGDKVEFSHHGH